MDGVKTEPSTRFDALDGVRAAAILAGVYYHALMFASMGGGRMFGPGGGGGSRAFQEYLHSFRMPLFFLISGFFSRMMLGKYGTREYLARRWTRIGLPMLVGLFVIVPLYQLTRAGMGGPPPGLTGRGPGGPTTGPGEMPPPPPGFVPPPLARFDANGDGSLSVDEWKNARESFARPGGPMPFGPRGGELGDRVFGSSSRLFRLEYLWFLWYLLIFATITPWLVKVPGWFASRVSVAGAIPDPSGPGVLRVGLAPMALGLVGGLALLIAPSQFGGWSLPLASGIFRGVPDFLFHLEPDQPFYLAYFLAGWWLHRDRDSLPEVSRAWMPFLLAGLAAHSASVALHASYGSRPGGPGLIRLGGYALYGVGSAYTAFGFLAMFQRYFDRPSRVGRYFADTALWVYLVHLPLLRPFLAAVTPLGLPWWLEGALAAALTTAAALLLFETIIRPTPLMRVFGPGGTRRRKAPVMATADVGS